MTHGSTTRPRLVCLLPARNAAADLPGYFASVERFADAIVALDDGSTDDTADLLAAHPLVKILLRNPQRPDYRGWNDAANRNRLLEAAAQLAPEWIISLDADERIDPADAAALRDFLATDALPGCAYGFSHVPMRGDPEHYLPRCQWVYRLFAFAPGQRFPDRRLHFVPVPVSIPRTRWIRTTLRIQHFGSFTPERRRARYEKYRQADPGRIYQAEYDHLLRDPDPAELRRWRPRPPGLPVLAAAVGLPSPDPPFAAGTADGAPALSAIIIARNDATTITRTVASVVGQACPEPFEVIVVVSGSPETAAIVRERFPQVTLIELRDPALPGEARNAGLRAARGQFVSFPGSHVELPPGSLAARLAAHRQGYAMVTGVALNGTPTLAGWASYFLDHHHGLPGHGRTILTHAPAHCSYARQPLLEVGGFPEGVRTAEDTAVNQALTRRGYVALRDPAITFVHRSPCRTPWRLLRHHFRRGRGWGRLLLEDYQDRGGLLNRQVLCRRLLLQVPRRLAQIHRDVRRADPALWPRYRRSLALIAAGALATWLGEWYEVLRPAPGKALILRGRPPGTIALIARAEATVILLRVDLARQRLRGVRLPGDLTVLDAHGQPLSLACALGLEPGPPLAWPSLDRLRDVTGRAVQLPVNGFVAVDALPPVPPPAPVHPPGDIPIATWRAELPPAGVRASSLPPRELRRLLRLLRRLGPVRLALPAADALRDRERGPALVQQHLAMPQPDPPRPAAGGAWLP